MSYRDSLKQEQAGMTASIERATGNRLDVVWNLTLAANLISANIPYGQLSAIQALPASGRSFWKTGTTRRYTP